MLRDGWLMRQFDRAAKEVATWPAWMRRGLPEDCSKTCPACGNNEWTWIPDSLAQFCKCGFVRVLDCNDKWIKGESLQQWAADIHRAGQLK